MNIKKTLAGIASYALVGAVALGIGGTLAHRTDVAKAENTAIVGDDIDIELYEKQRDGSNEVDFQQNQHIYPAYYEGTPTVGNDGFWTNVTGALDKIVYVDNIGDGDTYYRTIIAVESIGKNKILINKNEKDFKWENVITGVEIEGQTYDLYVATYKKILKPNDPMVSSLRQVAISKDATNDDIEKLGDNLDILVFAQACQVENLGTDPGKALDIAFKGAISKENHPWMNGLNGTWYDEEESTMKISSASELAYLAEMVNSGKDTFKGKTIKLMADIDLSGYDWAPIGQNFENPFQGTFDGNNHTVSNLTVKNGDDGTCVGLFGCVSGGTIKNLNVKDANVEGNYKVGVIAGEIYTKIENCTVEGATVVCTPRETDKGLDDGNNAGVIAGYIESSSTSGIIGCTAKNSTVTAFRCLGGIVGTATSSARIADNTVENVQLYYHTPSEGADIADNKTNSDAGEVAGRLVSSATEENNTVINVSLPPVTVNNNNELAAAIKEGKTSIWLNPGTYNAPKEAQGKTLTISGTKDSILEIVPVGQGEAGGQLDYNFDGSTVTFNGITIITTNKLYSGYARMSGTYNDCVIQNTYNLGLNTVNTFNNCEINITEEYFRVNAAKSAEFNNCTFNTDGRAILVYQDGSSHAQTVTVKDCTFNATEPAYTRSGLHVAAVSIDGTNGTYVVNLEGTNTVDSNMNGLWQIKTGAANVTVNDNTN